MAVKKTTARRGLRLSKENTIPKFNYFSKCNINKLHKLYIHWFIWRRMPDLNQLAGLACAYVGYIWRRGWGRKPLDPDLLDPVTYKIIMLFDKYRIPFHRKAMAKFLHVTARRAILDEMDHMYPGTPAPDNSMMTWPRRFQSDSDIENVVFLEELAGVLVERVKNGSRFSGSEKAACVSIAWTTLLLGKSPGYKLLRTKYGIRPKSVRFFGDYVKILLRNALYDIRASLPRSTDRSDLSRLYGDE